MRGLGVAGLGAETMVLVLHNPESRLLGLGSPFKEAYSQHKLSYTDIQNNPAYLK